MSLNKRATFFLVIVTILFVQAVHVSKANSSSTLKQNIVSALQKKGISEELTVVLVSTLPIFELRGGIPLALYTFDMSFARSYVLCVLGNLIPVIPLLLFLTTLSRILGRFRPAGKILNWFFDLTRRRGGLIEKYEAVGLILFVATPLPVTGAWTGAVASVLFGLRFRLALPSICLGVLIAGLVVSGVCWLGLSLFS